MASMENAEASQNDRSRGGMIGATGRRRALELARESETERQSLAAELLAALNRDATAVDCVAVEALSAATIRARRLRAAGRNDREELRLVVQLLRATGLKPPPPAAKPDEGWGLLLPEDGAPKADPA
jgi:hypothetical protein